MSVKKTSTALSSFIDNDGETESYVRLIKELDMQAKHEVGEVWMEAIDSLRLKDQLVNATSPWMIEDNNDALEGYMDDVSDFINLEDIDSFDWQ